ncbi:MAG: PEGA domain-containing protein, partial [Acidobacteria bacterium]|nr:PEGA domain-containing protein [Acidobacteriota bacterium]
EPTPTAAPAEAAPEKPAQRVEKPVAQPAPGPAAMDFRTTPGGARVTVDDNAALSCTSPCALNLAPGRHVVKVALAGYRDEVRIVEAPRDQAISVNLTPPSGSLFVRSTPPGASIFLNGRERPEKTPATITLPVGRYNLTLELNGRKAEQTVEIKDRHILEAATEW